MKGVMAIATATATAVAVANLNRTRSGEPGDGCSLDTNTLISITLGNLEFSTASDFVTNDGTLLHNLAGVFLL